ncbi:MAG: hypothetical protein ACK4GC_01915 [Paracoccaceae bacterium]
MTLLSFSSFSAVAQDANALFVAFEGEWFIFDPAYSEVGSNCILTLAKSPMQTLSAAQASDSGMKSLSVSNCPDQIRAFSSWTIEDSVLRFFNSQGALIAELGGNQLRITGSFTASGFGLILERATGDGTNAQLASAIRRHRCYFLGFTSDCTTDSDRVAPVFDTQSGRASVETLVNLQLRAQPRRDAPVLGAVSQGTCVRVNQCAIASDGTWCRALFGDVQAWLPQVAIRQSEWPIYTFRNGCTADTEG